MPFFDDLVSTARIRLCLFLLDILSYSFFTDGLKSGPKFGLLFVVFLIGLLIDRLAFMVNEAEFILLLDLSSAISTKLPDI
jgi:hypothetical protein